METTSTNSLSLLDHFTPSVLGLFWFTNEDLGRDLLGFDELNYLFDGLISQYIYREERNTKNHAHIFFTENFKEKIFLTHLKNHGFTKAQLAGDIDEHVALIQGSKKDSVDSRARILVLDKTNHSWAVELKKRYPQFEFVELSL